MDQLSGAATQTLERIEDVQGAVGRTQEQVKELESAIESVASSLGEAWDGLERETTELVAEVDSRRERLTTEACLLYTSPSPRDRTRSRMPSSA